MSSNKHKCPKCGSSDKIKPHKFIDETIKMCHGCGTRILPPEIQSKGDSKENVRK